LLSKGTDAEYEEHAAWLAKREQDKVEKRQDSLASKARMRPVDVSCTANSRHAQTPQKRWAESSEGQAYEDELASSTRTAMVSAMRGEDDRRLRRNARSEAVDEAVTERGTRRREAAQETLRRERLDAASRVSYPATDPSLPLAERVRLESQASGAMTREKLRLREERSRRERQEYEAERQTETEAAKRAGDLIKKKRDEKSRQECAAAEAYSHSAAGQAQSALRAKQLREATRKDTRGNKGGIEAALEKDLARVEEETPRGRAARQREEFDEEFDF